MPLLAFNVVVEAILLSRFVRLRFADVWRPMLWANICSLAAGVPVTILNAFLAEMLLPDEMVKRMGVYPLAISVGVLIYFLATLGVEWFVLRTRVNPNVRLRPRKALLNGVLAGQIASYAVLGPLFGVYAMPKQTVRSFTSDSQWASQPASPIVYVSPESRLESVLVDGTGLQTLVTNEVRDYVLSDDIRTVLFRGASNHYFLAKEGKVELVSSEPLVCYGQGMDFSPRGRFVALLDDSGTSVSLWDGYSGRVTKLRYSPKEEYFVRLLVWSAHENVFYIVE